MKLAVATTLAAVAAATTVADLKAQQQFIAFTKQYNKQYPTEEVFKRFNIFKKNVAVIDAHDVEAEGFSMAINEFADLTWDEFRVNHLGFNAKLKTAATGDVHKADASVKVADAVDWSSKGAVTPIKNQGQCGSCWAFSTTGSTEGAVAVKTGKLTSLSEQQLVDCAKPEGNMGCNGGLMDYGFEFIIKNEGIATEASYPYTAKDGKCKKRAPSAATITSYKDVAQDSDSLQSAVAQQPVSVAIEADQMAFQLYSGGVLKAGCGENLDHGVLLVGYGTDNGVDYWKVKNSWGATWGEEGYIRIARGKTPSECGITNSASYPIA